MILNYSNINGCDHYNIIHIKNIYNIKENIKAITKYISKKYNYYFLRKYNICSFLLNNKVTNLATYINKHINKSKKYLINSNINNLLLLTINIKIILKIHNFLTKITIII